jgi:hypothetical protein
MHRPICSPWCKPIWSPSGMSRMEFYIFPPFFGSAKFWYSLRTYVQAELLLTQKQKTAFRPYSFCRNPQELWGDKGDNIPLFYVQLSRNPMASFRRMSTTQGASSADPTIMEKSDMTGRHISSAHTTNDRPDRPLRRMANGGRNLPTTVFFRLVRSRPYHLIHVLIRCVAFSTGREGLPRGGRPSGKSPVRDILQQSS